MRSPGGDCPAAAGGVVDVDAIGVLVAEQSFEVGGEIGAVDDRSVDHHGVVVEGPNRQLAFRSIGSEAQRLGPVLCTDEGGERSGWPNDTASLDRTGREIPARVPLRLRRRAGTVGTG